MTATFTNLPPRPLLTDGQVALLQMVADGLGHDQIGRRLGISRSATSTRLDRIYNRLGAINAPNAVAIAIRAGLLPAPALARRGQPAAQALTVPDLLCGHLPGEGCNDECAYWRGVALGEYPAPEAYLTQAGVR